MERKAISDELLSILVCPETKDTVSLLSEHELQQLNQLISEGAILKKSGGKATDPLEAGLIRSDRKILYPVIEGIPVMLTEESLIIDQEL